MVLRSSRHHGHLGPLGLPNYPRPASSFPGDEYSPCARPRSAIGDVYGYEWTARSCETLGQGCAQEGGCGPRISAGSWHMSGASLSSSSRRSASRADDLATSLVVGKWGTPSPPFGGHRPCPIAPLSGTARQGWTASLLGAVLGALRRTQL